MSNFNTNVLYDKSYTCPVCNNSFKSKAIKNGKNQLVSISIDSRGTYKLIDPILYMPVMCPTCQYTAINKVFEERIRPKQLQDIKAAQSSAIQKQSFYTIVTHYDVIKKYKLALIYASIKRSSYVELGYISLIISWLYSDLNQKELETEFLQKAKDYLMLSYEQDNFPTFGFDVYSVIYLLCAINYKLENTSESKRLIMELISDSDCPPNVKNRAQELKELLIN